MTKPLAKLNEELAANRTVINDAGQAMMKLNAKRARLAPMLDASDSYDAQVKTRDELNQLDFEMKKAEDRLSAARKNEVLILDALASVKARIAGLEISISRLQTNLGTDRAHLERMERDIVPLRADVQKMENNLMQMEADLIALKW